MWFSTISRLFSSICADRFSASFLIVISDKSWVATTFARLSVVVIEELELFICLVSSDIYIYRVVFLASKILYASRDDCVRVLTPERQHQNRVSYRGSNVCDS
jgi:hypothetical protein